MKKKHRKKLRGIVHYCIRCKKKTEHYVKGEKWINYVERCKICNKTNYSEVLRKNWKEEENGKSW